MTSGALPEISLCLATSLDGKISAKPGAAPDFTSAFDRQKLFRLRAESDALLVGANTVRQETLPPLVRDKQFAEARIKAGKSRHPAAVIVSGSRNLPWDSAYFTQKQQALFLLTTDMDETNRTKIEHTGVHVLETGGEISLRSGLTLLKQQGYDKVLAEGGGSLTHALLQEGLVHRLFLTIAPVMIGGRETPSLCNGPHLEPLSRFTLVACERVEDELHVTYALP